MGQNMKESEAEARARGHLARLLELRSVAAPYPMVYRNQELADDCCWFEFRFPNQCWIGASWVIAVRKADGSVAYFGTDGSE